MQIWAVSLLTNGAQPPQSNCLTINCWYSEFDRIDEVSPYSILPVLYPQQEHQTLTLKLFRREPAITKFDQLFTAYHKSSDGVERPTGSGLPLSFDKVHPAHGKITWLRVQNMKFIIRAIHTRFRYAFEVLPLRQTTYFDSLAHSSIGTLQRTQAPAVTPCKHMVSGLFHSPLRGSFHLSLTVLVHYRSLKVFSLAGQFRRIHPSHSCLGLLRSNGKKI